jgi:hypothetical protein
MSIKTVQFLSIVVTALALVPGGAHLLELSNKLHLDKSAYITVQQIYRGWALLGIILIAAVLMNLVLAFLSRGQTAPMVWAIGSALLLGATLVAFFLWIYPVNQATSNWSVAADDWETMRRQWEYSHAGNAILTLLALCATTVSSLSWSELHP